MRPINSKLASTSAEIRQKQLATVTLESGLTFVIRRVSLALLTATRGSVPDLTALVAEEKEQEVPAAKMEALVRAYESMDKIIVAGTVDPAFVEKLKEAGDESLIPADLSLSDRSELASRIIEHSGFTPAAAREVSPLSQTSS